MDELSNRIAALERELEECRQKASQTDVLAATLNLIRQHAPVVLWTTDRNLRFDVSRDAWLIGNLPIEPLPLGVSLFDYFQTSDANFPAIRAALRALDGHASSYELEWVGRWWKAHVAPLRNDRQEIVGTVGIALDSTEQKLAVDARLAEEQRYFELIENAHDIVYTHDLQGRFTSMNRAAATILGYTREEALALRITDVMAQDQLEIARRAIQDKLGGAPHTTYELTLIHKHQQPVHVEVNSRILFHNGKPVGVQGIARDITERKRLEEQLRQTQKMEAIGVLAGGIAHDFNNLLTGILGYTDLLKLGAAPDTKLYESLDVIQKAAEQAARLTSQLLGFARRGKNQNIPVEINRVMNDVIELLSRTVDRRIEIQSILAPGELLVMGDPGQMHQVFLNLAINAKEAMPSGGLLLFQTEVVEAPAVELNAEKIARSGRFVAVTVSDTGVGIPSELKDRIFEPFFSTKESGSGMGLAMVYGIVKNHGGFVRVESEPGEGARLFVYLPLVERQTLHLEAERGGAAQHGHGRILVVDDEPLVRQVASAMLSGLGYQVVVQRDGEDAIAYYKRHWGEIDLVILDLIMPKVSGKDCFLKMREINPNAIVLLSSGYSKDGAPQEILDLGVAGFIQKPYQMRSLSEAVAHALRSSSS